MCDIASGLYFLTGVLIILVHKDVFCVKSINDCSSALRHNVHANLHFKQTL